MYKFVPRNVGSAGVYMYARECRSKGKGRGTGCVDMPGSAGCRDGRRGARL